MTPCPSTAACIAEQQVCTQQRKCRLWRSATRRIHLPGPPIENNPEMNSAPMTRRASDHLHWSPSEPTSSLFRRFLKDKLLQRSPSKPTPVSRRLASTVSRGIERLLHPPPAPPRSHCRRLPTSSRPCSELLWSSPARGRRRCWLRRRERGRSRRWGGSPLELRPPPDRHAARAPPLLLRRPTHHQRPPPPKQTRWGAEASKKGVGARPATRARRPTRSSPTPARPRVQIEKRRPRVHAPLTGGWE
jgi:hypothetical protein